MGHKILHRKQKYKQWVTNTTQKTKNINNGPQNTTKKTKYKQWATQYYTENKKYKQWAYFVAHCLYFCFLCSILWPIVYIFFFLCGILWPIFYFFFFWWVFL
jgi:hypothetical protein